MIKISRLKLKNFKSFKSSEIPLANGFTAIAGANASGKCVTGDTAVLLENGHYERIDSIVEKALATACRKKFLDDGVIGFEPRQKIIVYSLNPDTLKIEPATVNGFVKRRAPSKLLTVKTRAGREITTTDYHPLFGIENGSIQAYEAKELSKGIAIATPRKIHTTRKNKLFEELFSLIGENDNLFAPFNEKYLEIVNNFAKERKLGLKGTAKEIGVTENTLKGLKDGQAINIASLTKILKAVGYSNESIAELIPKIKGKTTKQTINAPWRNSKEFARLLGYFFAEGSSTGGNIRFVSASKEIINDIKNICQKVFGKSAFVKKYKQNCFDIIIFSRPIGKIFSKFCLQKNHGAKRKKVENIFFKHSDEETAEFLNGYLSGDGYVSEGGVSATTASKELAFNIFNMLLMLDVQPRIVKKSKTIKKSSFKGNYFEISVYGQENLKKLEKEISLVHKEKKQKLKKIVNKNKRHHSNVDLIPQVNQIIKNACLEHEVKYARKKNKNIKLKSYTDNACFPSRKGLQKVIQKEFSHVKNPSKNLVCLQKLAFSDIFWDEIVEIEEEKNKPAYVYDLSVNYNHNFIANNIIVHNSNILDALMFVFGITSLKMLRAARLSELINHDAKEGYAKVEIELKDGEKIYNISRIIDKRGVSILRLNGKKKTLNEITSLLQELGIKPTGYNIVVQGDITKVIQMNAKQRRAILDDVAGLAEFEEKKEESIRKLEQVQERIKDANLVLNERVNYLQELEKEKIAAQQFEGLSKELKQSKATILHSELKRNREEMAETEKKIEGLQEEIDKKEKQKKELQEQEGPLEEKVQQLTQKIIEASEKTYSTIVREIEEKKAQNSMLKEKIEEKKSQKASTKARISALKEEKNSLNEKAEQKKEQIKVLTRKIEEDSVEWQKLRNLIDEKSKAVKSKNLETLESKLKGLREQTEKIQSTLFEKKLLKEKLLKEKEINENLLSLLSNKQKKLERSLEKKNDIQNQIKEISLSDPQTSIEAKEKELNNVLEALHSFKSKKDHIKDSVLKLKSIDSACPVCDQKIDSTTVQRLLEQRDKQIKEIHIDIEKKTKEKERLEMEKQSLIHELHQLHDLKARHDSFEGLEQELQEVKMQLNEAKQKQKLSRLKDLESEETRLSGVLESMSKEKHVVEEKISSIKKSPAATELNQLIEKFNQINLQKGEKENNLAVLKTQVEETLKDRIQTVEKERNSLQEDLISLERELVESEEKLIQVGKELAEKEAKMHKATQATKLLEEEKERITIKLKNIEEKIDAAEQKISKKEKEINELKISKSRNEIRIQDLGEEFKDFEGTQILKEAHPQELKKRIPELEKQIKKLGAINMKALERFEELKKEVDNVREKADKLEEERKAVVELIDKIELKKISVFMECFNVVSKKFSDIYYHFFEGEGKLSLADPQNPTEGGLLIEAKYKEDTLKSIDAMSGGEKALTALAFIFAIQSFDPAPFYIFDEADAALDKENSLKLARMIREISKKSQFVSITHNDLIIKEADQIMGVALTKQKSSVIGLRLKGKIEA